MGRVGPRKTREGTDPSNSQTDSSITSEGKNNVRESMAQMRHPQHSSWQSCDVCRGAPLQIDAMIRIARGPQFSNVSPYAMRVFWAMACVSMIFGVIGLISVPPLWHLDDGGRRLCNWLFGTELVYWVANSQITILLAMSNSEWIHSLGTSMGPARASGGMATAPQFLTLYPVWALVLLNLAYRAKNKSTVPR